MGTTTLYDLLLTHTQHKKDGRTFGLVLQGGGMRGVYSAGAIAPLIQYGFTDTFEHVIGSSAGAITGAYFIGADPGAMYSYTEDLTNKKFVNLLRHEKKVDIDYLVDLVLQQKRPVNTDRLLASPSKLHIVMTDAKNGKKVVLSDHHRFMKIYEEFRATAALPLLYDKRILVNNHWYIDGGVSDLLPVDVAVKLGCTDIVVVMTQQLKRYTFDKRHERLVNHLVKHFAKDQPENIRKILPTNEKMLQFNLHKLTHPTKKTRFYVLDPTEDELLVSLGTINKPKIKALAQLGVADMDAFLHKPLTLQ